MIRTFVIDELVPSDGTTLGFGFVDNLNCFFIKNDVISRNYVFGDIDGAHLKIGDLQFTILHWRFSHSKLEKAELEKLKECVSKAGS